MVRLNYTVSVCASVWKRSIIVVTDKGHGQQRTQLQQHCECPFLLFHVLTRLVYLKTQQWKHTRGHFGALCLFWGAGAGRGVILKCKWSWSTFNYDVHILTLLPFFPLVPAEMLSSLYLDLAVSAPGTQSNDLSLPARIEESLHFFHCGLKTHLIKRDVMSPSQLPVRRVFSL